METNVENKQSNRNDGNTMLGARVSFVSKVLIYKPTMYGKVVFESENYVKILPDDRRIGYCTRMKHEVERI